MSKLQRRNSRLLATIFVLTMASPAYAGPKWFDNLLENITQSTKHRKDLKKELEAIENGKSVDGEKVNSGQTKKDTGIEVDLFDPKTILDEIGKDLSAEAKAGKYDNIEVDPKLMGEIVADLRNPSIPNVLLLASAGVGKTSTVQALAKHLNGMSPQEYEMFMDAYNKSMNDMVELLLEFRKEGQKLSADDEARRAILEALVGSRPKGQAFGYKELKVMQIDSTILSAGTHYVGSFEQKVMAIQKYIELQREQGVEVILFIDEVHELGRAGVKGEGHTDKFKSFLTSGVRTIAATTNAEAEQLLYKDQAFMRRWNKRDISAPDLNQTVRILKTQAAQLTKHYGVRIPDEVLPLIAAQGQRFYPEFAWPGNAIKVMQQVVGEKSLLTVMEPKRIKELRKDFEVMNNKLKDLKQQLDNVVESGGSTEALRKQIEALTADSVKKFQELAKLQQVYEAQLPFSEEIVRLSDQLKAKRSELKQSLSRTIKDEAEQKAADANETNLVNEIKELETQIADLEVQRAEAVPEVADYGYITSDDVYRTLMEREGVDPERLRLNPGDMERELYDGLVRAFRGQEELAARITDRQRLALTGLRQTNSTNGKLIPTIYTTDGAGDLVKRAAQTLNDIRFGRRLKPVFVDLNIDGSQVETLFGALSPGMNVPSGKLVKELNTGTHKVIVFENVDQVGDPRILEVLERIAKEGAIDVFVDGRLQTVSFANTEIFLQSGAISRNEEVLGRLAEASELDQMTVFADGVSRSVGENTRLQRGLYDLLSRGNVHLRFADLDINDYKEWILLSLEKMGQFGDKKFNLEINPKVLEAFAQGMLTRGMSTDQIPLYLSNALNSLLAQAVHHVPSGSTLRVSQNRDEVLTLLPVQRSR